MGQKTHTKPKGATIFRETKFGILSRREIVELEAQGIQRGLKLVSSLARKRAEITPELILSIHKKSFGWIFPKWAGKFRQIEVEFSGKQAPAFFQAPVMIKELCDDLRERLKHIPPKNQPEEFLREIVSLIAWFQHKFVWIHPFNDYNGRTARLLSNVLFLKFSLPTVEIKVESKKDRDIYIQAMWKADGGDYAPLEAIISQSLQESLRKGL